MTHPNVTLPHRNNAMLHTFTEFDHIEAYKKKRISQRTGAPGSDAEITIIRKLYV